VIRRLSPIFEHETGRPRPHITSIFSTWNIFNVSLPRFESLSSRQPWRIASNTIVLFSDKETLVINVESFLLPSMALYHQRRGAYSPSSKVQDIRNTSRYETLSSTYRFPKVGFGWAMRICAFLIMAALVCALSNHPLTVGVWHIRPY